MPARITPTAARHYRPRESRSVRLLAIWFFHGGRLAARRQSRWRPRLDVAFRKADILSFFVTVKGGGHDGFRDAANERLEAFRQGSAGGRKGRNSNGIDREEEMKPRRGALWVVCVYGSKFILSSGKLP